jgi:hypothetical protein
MAAIMFTLILLTAIAVVTPIYNYMERRAIRRKIAAHKKITRRK